MDSLTQAHTVVCQGVTTPSSTDVPKRGSHVSPGSRTHGRDGALGRARFSADPEPVLPQGALADPTQAELFARSLGRCSSAGGVSPSHAGQA